MPEVDKYRLQKKYHIGSSWKWSYKEKWFMMFLQILRYVEKLKISKFAKMNTFIEDKN
jgi:hypothetical protein